MSVPSQPQRRAEVRARSRVEADVPMTRRALRHGNAAHRRRMHRLRRSVLVAITALLFGTVVARVTQDPAVALPRSPVAPTARTGATDQGNALGSSGAPSAGTTGATSAGSGPRTNASANGALAASVAAAAGSPTAIPATSPSPTSPVPSPGDAEEGVAEPVASPGATLTDVPQFAAGTLHSVAIPDLPAHNGGRVVHFAVEIEDGLPVVDSDFAAVVARVLADDRGWQTSDSVHFVPVSPADLAAGARVDIRVALATPTLTAKLCAPLDTVMAQVSCWNGSRAVLNLQRWLRGSATYGDDLDSYRVYLVNHEVGHGLGHRHASCPAAGAPAPIMVQQTKSLDGCTAWQWPTRP